MELSFPIHSIWKSLGIVFILLQSSLLGILLRVLLIVHSHCYGSGFSLRSLIVPRLKPLFLRPTMPAIIVLSTYIVRPHTCT